MEQLNQDMLRQLSKKYIWWETADEAVSMPYRIIAQVMNIGDYTDVQAMAAQVGDEVLREVLIHAKPGQFNEKSWVYWHYRLGVASIGHVPQLPRRRFD